MEVKVLYENISCSQCLSVGHLSTKCPYRVKPALLKSPSQAALLKTPPITDEVGTDLVPIVSEKALLESPTLGYPGPLAPRLEHPGPLPKPLVDPITSGSSQSYSLLIPKLPPSTNGSHAPDLNPAIDFPTNDPNFDNPILTLPLDVAQVILEKILAPTLDCSNPFSILEHYTLSDPTSSTSQSKNLLEVLSILVVSILGPSMSPIVGPSVNTLPVARKNPLDLPLATIPV